MLLSVAVQSRPVSRGRTDGKRLRQHFQRAGRNRRRPCGFLETPPGELAALRLQPAVSQEPAKAADAGRAFAGCAAITDGRSLDRSKRGPTSLRHHVLQRRRTSPRLPRKSELHLVVPAQEILMDQQLTATASEASMPPCLPHVRNRASLEFGRKRTAATSPLPAQCSQLTTW